MERESEEQISQIRMIERRFIRCDWCGIPVSKKWIDYPEEGHYCSGTCLMAALPYRDSICAATCMISLLNLLMFMINSFITIAFAVVLDALIISLIAILWSENRRAKRDRQKDSRRYEIITASPSATIVNCQSCDEQLDLSLLRDDKILKCDFCGTMNVVFIDEKKAI